MTEPASGAEHYATILAGVITIVSSFFLTKLGSAEGGRVAEEPEPSSTTTRVNVGAALLDATTYKAITDGLAAILDRLDKLVELTEGKEEKALREHIRDDFRGEMREMAESFRRLISSASPPNHPP